MNSKITGKSPDARPCPRCGREIGGATFSGSESILPSGPAPKARREDVPARCGGGGAMIRLNHVSIQEKGDHPLTLLFPKPAILPMEPLPQHTGYFFSAPIEGPNVQISAYFLDGSFRKLEGHERDEVRRWILGGLALERIVKRVDLVK